MTTLVFDHPYEDDSRQILVTIYDEEGVVEVSERTKDGAVWGPPWLTRGEACRWCGSYSDNADLGYVSHGYHFLCRQLSLGRER